MQRSLVPKYIAEEIEAVALILDMPLAIVLVYK